MKAAETYKNDLDFEVVIHDDNDCSHENIHIEKACCSVPGDSGYIECGCGGKDNIVCDNPNCDGVDEYEFSQVYDKLIGGGSDCE